MLKPQAPQQYMLARHLALHFAQRHARDFGVIPARPNEWRFTLPHTLRRTEWDCPTNWRDQRPKESLYLLLTVG